MALHLEDQRREEIEKIVTEKLKEALSSDGLISEAMKMDERFAYIGKDIYTIKNDVQKLREESDKLLERDILRALEKLKQEIK